MELDSNLIRVGAFSLLVSFVLLIFLWRAEIFSKWKLLYSFVVLVPVIGPIMYIWIRNFPARNPKHLDGFLGGIGRRYLDHELSARGNARPVHSIHDIYSGEDHQPKARRRKKKRKKDRK
jgi:hypothetical protein